MRWCAWPPASVAMWCGIAVLLQVPAGKRSRDADVCSAAGGSLAALQQILGHSSVVVTQRCSRIADDLVLREVERIEGRRVAKMVANGVEARAGSV